MPDRIAFEKPPVVETVLGVEFPTIQGWGVQHFGLYLASIRDRFPKFEPQPALSPTNATPGIQLQLGPPSMRGWYIDSTETRVIQIQNDRFNYNWRERPGNERYPMYESLRPEFQREWDHFRKFLLVAGLADITPVQGSVTYINHIPRGGGWETPNDLGRIIKVWDQQHLPPHLGRTEFVNLSAAYRLDSGRLVRFEVQPGLRLADKTEVVQLTVMVSGRLESADLLSWFDSAQRELVQCFVDFTVDDIQRNVWMRKD